MWGRIKNRESSFACYRTTPLIHTGYAYSERALTETGTDQDWLAIPWNSNRGSRTSRDPIHNKLPQAATIPLCRVASAPLLNMRGPRLRYGYPLGVRQEKWLREDAATDHVILPRVVRLIAVARDPLAHLGERSGSV